MFGFNKIYKEQGQSELMAERLDQVLKEKSREELKNFQLEKDLKQERDNKIYYLSELNYLKDDYKELDYELKERQEKIEQTQFNNLQLEREREKLLITIDDLREQIRELQAKCHSKDNCLEEANIKNDSLKTRFKEMEKVMKDLNSQNNDLISDLNIANSLIDELECEKEELQNKIVLCQQNEMRKEDEMDKLKNVIVKYENEKKMLEERLDRNIKEDKTMRISLNKLRKEHFTVESIKNRLENEISSYQLNIKNYEKQIEEIKNELDESILKRNELQKLLEANNGILAERNEKLFKLNQIMKTLHDNRSTAEQKLLHQSDDIERLRDENKEIKSKNDDLKNEITELKVVLNDVKRINDDKTVEISNLKNEVGELKTKLMDLELEQDNLNYVNSKYQDTIDELSLELIRKRKTSQDRKIKNNYENKILMKIIETGWNQLTFQELSDLHEIVTNASQKMIEEGRAVIPEQVTVNEEDLLNITRLSSDKKSMLKKINDIQNNIAKGQYDANKRICTLTHSIQQYQRELINIRLWNQQFDEQQKKGVSIISEVKEYQQKLKEEAMLSENQLYQFVLLAEEAKEQANKLKLRLDEALEKINSVEEKLVQDK